MINFKNPNDMLPSEMATYIAALHNEIEILAKKALVFKDADTFAAAGNTGSYGTKEELLEEMDIGEVIEAVSFKKIEQSFVVKISKERIDNYPTRIEAEAAGMLHSV